MKTAFWLLTCILTAALQGCSGAAFTRTTEVTGDFPTTSVGFSPPFRLSLAFAPAISPADRQILTHAIYEAFERQHIALSPEGYVVGIEVTKFQLPAVRYSAILRLSCGNQYALQGRTNSIPWMAAHVVGETLAQVMPLTD